MSIRKAALITQLPAHSLSINIYGWPGAAACVIRANVTTSWHACTLASAECDRVTHTSTQLELSNGVIEPPAPTEGDALWTRCLLGLASSRAF